MKKRVRVLLSGKFTEISGVDRPACDLATVENLKLVKRGGRGGEEMSSQKNTVPYYKYFGVPYNGNIRDVVKVGVLRKDDAPALNVARQPAPANMTNPAQLRWPIAPSSAPANDPTRAAAKAPSLDEIADYGAFMQSVIDEVVRRLRDLGALPKELDLTIADTTRQGGAPTFPAEPEKVAANLRPGSPGAFSKVLAAVRAHPERMSLIGRAV